MPGWDRWALKDGPGNTLAGSLTRLGSSRGTNRGGTTDTRGDKRAFCSQLGMMGRKQEHAGTTREAWRDLKGPVSQWQVAGSGSSDQVRIATAHWLLMQGSARLGARGKTERPNARMRGVQRSPEHR